MYINTGVYSDYSQDFGIDFTTILTDIGTGIKNVFDPPSGPTTNPTPPVVVTPTVTPPLFTIGGIAVTPARLLVGVAVVGTVIYLTQRKGRRR